MSQHRKGHVSVNIVGKAHNAPGTTDAVHAGQFDNKGPLPRMSMAPKYDHGHGPKDYSPHNKSVSGTGKSQDPHKVTLKANGIGRNVEGRRKGETYGPRTYVPDNFPWGRPRPAR